MMIKDATENYYPYIIETIESGIWVTDNAGQTLYVNRKMAQLLGTTVESLQTKNVAEYLTADQATLDLLPFGHLHLTDGIPERFERRYRKTDGSELLTSVSAKVFSHNGHGFEIAMLHNEIAETKEAEEALPLTRENIDRILTSLKEYAVITLNRDRRILSWNAGAEAVFGYIETEIINDVSDRLFTPEDQQTRQPEKEIESAIQNGNSYDDRWHIRKDGSRFFAKGITIHLTQPGKPPLFIKIARDWTEKKKMEEMLVQADRHKNEFLATLAHELRNPLASILSGVEVLKQEQDRENLKSCQVVERQVQQMIHLVNDLLDISRISLGKIKIVKQPVNLIDAIHLALDTSRQILEGYKHALSISLPSGAIMVNGDLGRLCQVFLNILINSAKYTSPGGNISLQVTTDNNNVVVCIRDNGMGIPSEMLSSIFEMFEQIQDRSEYPQAGLGIGLSVVKQLVEMHSGTVEARSQGANMGSEFEVTLPILQPAAEANQPRTIGIAGLKGKLAGASEKKKILLVDDNTDATDMMEILLTRKGFVTRKANDGESGIKAALEFDPEIVILDLGLPDIDGYAVLKALQEQLGKRFYLALSGWGQQEDINRSREAGFDRHLVKPIDFNSLLTVLESYK